jgi:predicted transcriptional regulator of viral defense system
MVKPEDKLAGLVRTAGVIRPRDLDDLGLPRHRLAALAQRGLVQRVGRGLYLTGLAATSEFHTVAEAAKMVPHGVVCLLTALRMHGLTTQAPSEVWLAIPHRSWKPKVEYPPLRIMRFSGEPLTEHVQVREIEGVEVRVYDPAKTVADCFKFRNKVGLDVAMEALRDCLRRRLATVDQLHAAAVVCRVGTVMKPYLEAVMTGL